MNHLKLLIVFTLVFIKFGFPYQTFGMEEPASEPPGLIRQTSPLSVSELSKDSETQNDLLLIKRIELKKDKKSLSDEEITKLIKQPKVEERGIEAVQAYRRLRTTMHTPGVMCLGLYAFCILWFIYIMFDTGNYDIGWGKDILQNDILALYSQGAACWWENNRFECDWQAGQWVPDH